MHPQPDIEILPVLRSPAAPSPRLIDPAELEYIAFSGRQDIAHGIFRSIPEAQKSSYASRYVLSEVIAGGIRKLRTFLAASSEEAASDEKAFIDDTAELFLSTCRTSATFPRELFRAVMDWSEELARLSLLNESLRYYDVLLGLDIAKFPQLHVRALLGKASVLTTLGSIREAWEILHGLADRPYVIVDRNQVPAILFELGRGSLLKGEVVYYKRLLFRGLRHFTTRVEDRRLFVDQIRKTYRRSYRVLLDPHLAFSSKVLFALHRMFFALEGNGVFRRAGIPRLVRPLVLGYVYAHNYLSPYSLPDGAGCESPRIRSRTIRRARRTRVLVTRAMGGIGDLLMMTPGFHALKRRHPQWEIHLAVPRRYFPLFEGNPDVTLLDIEDPGLDATGYRRWYNFTDCPAARVESRSAPRVRRDRIEIFARSLGLSPFAVRRMEKRPRYTVLPGERVFQQTFWRRHGLVGERVIGIQLRSDEVYRDYPRMEELVAAVARTCRVLLFDAETIPGTPRDGVIHVDGLPLRRAFALASACDAIVAPDSSFVHLAAALELPCVALFGPIDGRLRTRHYPLCTHLDLRARLGCSPCWRNDQIPCALTGMRGSVCMLDLPVNDVLAALSGILNERTPSCTR